MLTPPPPLSLSLSIYLSLSPSPSHTICLPLTFSLSALFLTFLSLPLVSQLSPTFLSPSPLPSSTPPPPPPTHTHTRHAKRPTRVTCTRPGQAEKGALTWPDHGVQFVAALSDYCPVLSQTDKCPSPGSGEKPSSLPGCPFTADMRRG